MATTRGELPELSSDDAEPGSEPTTENPEPDASPEQVAATRNPEPESDLAPTAEDREPEPEPLLAPPVGRYDPFYTQHVSVGGLDVIAPTVVSPVAVRRTAAIIAEMLVNRPDILEMMAQTQYVVVSGQHMTYGDIPEEQAIAAARAWGEDADYGYLGDPVGGGAGPSDVAPYVLVGEGNLLCSIHDSHPDEDMSVHQVARGIHYAITSGPAGDHAGHIVAVMHERALAAGLWEGHLAATGPWEYFAEVFQSWAGVNDDHAARLHSNLDTPEGLWDYDPAGAAFMDRHFGGVDVRSSCDSPQFDPSHVPEPTFDAGTVELLPAPPEGLYHEVYTQFMTAGPVHIIAQDDVSPLAMHAVAATVLELLVNRPDILEMMAQTQYVVVGGEHALERDIPEYVADNEACGGCFDDYADQSIRGGGGPRDETPFTLVAQANALCTIFDSHPGGNVVIHELAHGIHYALLRTEGGEAFDARLEALYDAAMAAGLWQFRYSATNHGEYFAEGVQFWVSQNDYIHTRAELWAYDPGLAALLEDLFGDIEVPSSCHHDDWPPEAEAASLDCANVPLRCYLAATTILSDDHSNFIGDASPAPLGADVVGALEYRGDKDFFVFEAVQGGLYQIDVTPGTLEDPTATLYGSDGSHLAYNDDHDATLASRLHWEATISGPHYVAVEGWNNTGTYTLTIVRGQGGEPTATTTALPPWSGFEIIAPPSTHDRVYGPYDPYYTQAVALGSLHIIGDAAIDPEALQRTALIISQMLANRPDVIDQLARWTYVVVGKTQRPIGTVPEVQKQALTEVFLEDLDTHIIGGGWGPSACLGCEGGGGAPYTMVSESNVMCHGEPTDTHTTEDVAVHELVHGIHTSFELEQEAAGVAWEDSFDGQLQRLYADAMQSGRWEGHYATTDRREYFAEMWQFWSGVNDNDYGWTMTLDRPFDLPQQRFEMASYDPKIAGFIAEHFGETPVTASCHYYGD